MTARHSSDHPETLPAEVARRLGRLERLARLMDDGARVPGTSIRFGLDPLFGLVPAVGDLLGALIALFVVVEAQRLGVPRAILLRMLVNILVDGLLGSVPLLGDLFDVAWRANRRNLTLLRDYLERTHAGLA